MDSTRLRDPHHLEIVREARRRPRAGAPSFDRIAFACRVLAMLQPPKWSVALYLRGDDFHLDRGRDLRHGQDAIWATVGIPSSASRAEIAVALAELTGMRDVPFLVDLVAADVTAPL